MLTERRLLDPISAVDLFKQNPVRMTPTQIADALCCTISEVIALRIPVGEDGKIGPQEIARWQGF